MSKKKTDSLLNKNITFQESTKKSARAGWNTGTKNRPRTSANAAVKRAGGSRGKNS